MMLLILMAGDFEFKLEELTSDGFVKENGVTRNS